MTDALEDHEGIVRIGSRTITNLRFADDIDGLATDVNGQTNIRSNKIKTGNFRQRPNTHTHHHHHHHHQSLNREGRWGTTDDFAISFLHFPLFSTALWDLTNCRPVHSLMSFHLILLSALFSSPFTVPCKKVLARPDEQET